ncbi:MAG TPA: Clp protease ClpP [Bacteroidales bacterium]|nr:Clp protease ClpP [Bacteroidales bacterium]
MMEAVLKIYGDIGEPDKMMEMFDVTDDTISAKIVSDFLDENKDATAITVRINSRGGDVQEGWAIHDLLVNSGKKIKTIGEGKVYSIATIVFLAGTEREFMKNADGLIHNPYIPEYTMAGKYEAGDLELIAESLRQEEAKILDFYVRTTGADETKLAEYMKEDTKLSAEDMLSLGFATKILEPITAYAFMKPIKLIKMDDKSFMDKVEAAVNKAITALGLSRISDQTLKDKDGKEFNLEKESGAPAVGDKATPDGSFTMADGKTVTIAGGEVTEVKEPDKSELDLANEKIAALEAQIAASEDVKAEAEKVKEEAAAMKATAMALVTDLTNLKNSWKPEARTKFATVNKVGRVDLDRVKEIQTNKIK